jgi:1-pyrroline-5-carboxylate dehydrogenase
MPANEPVLSYAPGSPERKRLKEVLAELKKEQLDVPMYIGSKEVRTNKKGTLHPPHEICSYTWNYSEGDERHVKQAIDAALAAKESWG